MIKKFFSMVVVCLMTVSCLTAMASAAEGVVDGFDLTITRATGRFNAEIPGNTVFRARTDFPLEVGETVAINASYSPQSASVDFGLIAPDGLFYAVNTTDGSFDEVIEVNQRGHYTLAIRNNSNETVSVSGFVTY